MIGTVIERAGSSAALRAVGWQQLVDLLARRSEQGNRDPVDDPAYSALESWRPDVPPERRALSCVALTGRTVPERLFHHLVADTPTIVGPMLVGAHIDDDVLIGSLSRLSGPARALLRLRPNPTSELKLALDAYGPADRALATDERDQLNILLEEQPIVHGEAVWSTASASPVPIRTLVDRIDRHRRRAAGAPPKPRHNIVVPHQNLGQFAFETDSAGLVVWTDSPSRGAVIGLGLLDFSTSPGGPDNAPDRFVRRLPIDGAQLTLSAGGAMEGAWWVDAVPIFAPYDGRFQGYVGQACRNPTRRIVRSEPSWWSNDYRQFIHELRTPLNAIIGFSELIGEELLGPVDPDFGRPVADVRHCGRAVLAAVEDVDLAARLDAGPVNREVGTTDLTAAVVAHLASCSGAPLRARLTEPHWVDVAPSTTRRLVERLVDGLAAAMGEGESLALTVVGRKRPRLRIAKPQILADVPQHQLVALRMPDLPASGGPLLGLEFTLRLVRRLAEEAGGALTVDCQEFTLFLPPVLQQDRTRQQ